MFFAEYPSSPTGKCPTTNQDAEEFIRWRNLCQQLPEVSEDACLRFVKLQMRGDVVNGDKGGETPTNNAVLVGGKKRKQEKVGVDSGGVTAKRAGGVERKPKSDEKAKEIILDMHSVYQGMVEALLPGVTPELQNNKKDWEMYKTKIGREKFGNGTILTSLLRSKSASTCYTVDMVKEELMKRDPSKAGRFYKYFPTFQKLQYKMKSMGLTWTS